MFAASDTMSVDSLVLLYQGPDRVDYVYLEPAGVTHNKFGAFYHADMIGKSYGSRILARDTKGWLVALAPTPELWASSLRHRTQIVHQLDAAIVSFQLGLRDGSVVAEAGTGSGAMTTALARCCRPSGHVYTFEFHAERATAARDEFKRNGLDCVTVEHADVCVDGFEMPRQADAVFLDLPEPWRAVPHARTIARPGATFASYSPCVEQVSKTLEALKDFLDVRTVEARQREFAVNDVVFESFGPKRLKSDRQADATPLPNMRGHTAFLTFATFPVDKKPPPASTTDKKPPRPPYLRDVGFAPYIRPRRHCLD